MATLLAYLLLFGCEKNGPQEPQVDLLANSRAELKIEQFCGNCHPLPSPQSFPRVNWPAEVEQGFQFYTDSGRTDLDEPVVQDVIDYFQSRAPDKITLPSAESFPEYPSLVHFEPSPLLLSGEDRSLTADLKWLSDSETLLLSDMANSKLRRLRRVDLTNLFAAAESDRIVLPASSVAGSGDNLCRMSVCDWNQDELPDYLVAEIGSMNISDLKLGSVALYSTNQDGSLTRTVLADQLARPAEAQPFDYDGDGDLDIIIAEFGYIRAGCLSLLRNTSSVAGLPSSQDFKYEVIDPRHGHVAVLLADMNGDGQQDIVTAIGQEYETVQIRYNQGGGNYRSEIVMALPDPSYNTSSITLADIDQDGRMDILHTCGDIFDSFVPKEFHGVRWIRNLGQRRWEIHELGMMIGAMQARAADFDLDGDLDIAAVGLFPSHRDFVQDMSFDSVVWWEQQPGMKFVRHSIERDRCLHSSCAVADVDGDGRPDLIVGEWAEASTPASARVFWNRAKSGSAQTH